MIAPTPFFADRGCHVRIYEEAHALIQAGHKVCIVTYHIGHDMPGIPTIRIPSIPWYNKLEAGPSWQKPFLDFFLFFTALKTARIFHPNLIHAHLHEGAFIGFLLKKILQVPMLFDYQGSLSGESLSHGFYKKGSIIHCLFTKIESFINQRADAIITSSTSGKDELTDNWNIPVQKTYSLIDGVDTSIFKPYQKKVNRKKFGIPDDAQVIVYLGLFNHYQGLDTLLNALEIVFANNPKAHALLMGFPDKMYRQKAANLGLGSRIHFTGRIPYNEAPEFLSIGDIAVSPKLSKTEANGKLFNYMACGLPTVVFESKINREILSDHGIYADFANPESFAQKILTTLNDKDKLKAVGVEIRNYALNEHSWKSRGQELINIYNKILSKR